MVQILLKIEGIVAYWFLVLVVFDGEVAYSVFCSIHAMVAFSTALFGIAIFDGMVPHQICLIYVKWSPIGYALIWTHYSTILLVIFLIDSVHYSVNCVLPNIIDQVITIIHEEDIISYAHWEPWCEYLIYIHKNDSLSE